jgi:hypothetical protein
MCWRIREDDGTAPASQQARAVAVFGNLSWSAFVAGADGVDRVGSDLERVIVAAIVGQDDRGAAVVGADQPTLPPAPS